LSFTSQGKKISLEKQKRRRGRAASTGVFRRYGKRGAASSIKTVPRRKKRILVS
jgi:ATP/ADP translocase